jgi:S-DNA-T family DNA segregation ATPase FtsK/SpoIIIE
MDSRVVLDAMGADKLLGNGDMLFLWPGTSNLLRGQGTYLTDEEIESVTESVSTGEQNFVHELMHIKVQAKEGEEGAGGLPNRDDMYAQAVDVVIREGRGSVSLLQRALGIGYGRAARLVDFMEQDGIVGTYNGSKSREVIMSIDQWQQMQAGSAAAADDEPAAPQIASAPGRVTKLAASTAKKSPPKSPASDSKRMAPPPDLDDEDELEEDGDEQDELFAEEDEDAAEFDAADYEAADELDDEEEYDDE